MLNGHVFGILWIQTSKLLSWWETFKVAVELDVFALRLVHLDTGDVLNGSLDVESLDNFDKFACFELGIS
jgi:hypothetical protein